MAFKTVVCECGSGRAVNICAELYTKKLHLLFDVATFTEQVLHFKFAALLMINCVIKCFCYKVRGLGTYLSWECLVMLDLKLLTSCLSKLFRVFCLSIHKYLRSVLWRCCFFCCTYELLGGRSCLLC